MFDFHVHSNYSDGRPLPRMLAAADEVGLDAVGITDHCNVSERESAYRSKLRKGFNLDMTYERRREAIESFREEYPMTIYDAVEMDYHPADEAEIGAFLDEADFDYAIGSVHYLDEVNLHDREHFAALDGPERRRVVERYFERTVSLVESGLFDVVSHPDLVERNPHLRGFATDEQYAAVADALAASDTVTELNAGRVDRSYGEFHPAPAFIDELVAHGVPLTVGSDAHTPGALRERHGLIEDALAERGIDPVRVL